MQVILLPEVLEYLEDLAEILYEKGYFSFEETSLTYVSELYDDIVSNLPIRTHKPAPKRYDKYGKGMKYASFKKNRRTTWYAFFSKYKENGETFYLVRYTCTSYNVRVSATTTPMRIICTLVRSFRFQTETTV